MKLTFKALLLVCLLPFVHPGPINIRAPEQEQEQEQEPDPYRLPEGLSPTLYKLTLTVDLDKVSEKNSKYSGSVNIDLDVTKDVTDAVKLHSDGKCIMINKKSLIDAADPNKAELLDPAEAPNAYNETTNILTLKLVEGTKLAKDNKYLLSLEFQGTYRDDMYGFYKSSYVDSNNKTHWLVTTQFESVYARSAFPCFDEPGLKANYEIKIKVAKASVEKGYHALSNTPVKSNDTIEENVVYEFERTPERLSSYLVAFIVSDFKSNTSEVFFNKDKPFRTWGQERYITNNEDALSQTAGPAVLDIYSKILQKDFAYQKVDQVGIPDFSAGAMENWGLTTYRERMLFFNEESNSVAVKQSTVAVTAHELAHQWFGDLVTLHFWDDIWLNEGFADFFEYHGSALIDVDGLNTSSWNYVGQFVTDELQSTAFEVDGLESARPLTSPVSKPEEIEPNFDSIAYSKGGSVIRMWQHVLTEVVFHKGLQHYLSNCAGTNSKPEDLLQAFQEAYDSSIKKPNLNGLKVQDAFENWHKTEGYPVLKVEHVADTTYNFTQERFLWKIDEAKRDKPFVWHIPISYSTFENLQFDKTEAQDWLKIDEDSKVIPLGDENAEKPKWIIINNQEAGYYRVNYDEDNWNALAEQLKNDSSVIHEINRAQIIDDALSLARSTKNEKPFLTYDIALELTKYLSQEKDYLPWAAASSAFSFLNTKLSSDANYKFFQVHVSNLVKERYGELGLEVKADDSHLNRLLRIVIASWACKLGDDDKCVTDAVKLFNEKTVVSPDVKSIVYCTAVRNNTEAWDKVWEEYKAADNNLDQTILLSALGCTKDEDKLKTHLDRTIQSDSEIRTQDSSAAFSSVYNGNPENVQIALEFLSKNMTEIAKTYGGTDPLGKLIIGLANKVVEAADIQTLTDIIEAIKASDDPKVQKAIKSADLVMDTLVSTQHWLELKQASISDWLKKSYDDSNNGDGDGGAAEITVSVLTVASCLALLFSS